jgi:CSLREA domain-containing protein
MIANRFGSLFRLLIPVCLLTGLLLATPGVTVRSAPATTPYVVTTTVDEFGTGSSCSLREAIQSVNTNTDFGGCTGDGDVITLPAGFYTLTGAADEDNNATGDLDVRSNLTIYGAGSGTTFIQAGTNATNGVDRVLHIFDGYTVGINDVTIRYGHAPDGVDGVSDSTCDGEHGGGIHSGTDTTLILNDCVVIYNRSGDGGDFCTTTGIIYGSGGEGGGIYSLGILELNDTTVRGNETGDGGDGAPGDLARQGGDGGGIYLYAGEATLTDSIVSTNVTGAGGNGSDRPSGSGGNGGSGGQGGGIFGFSSVLTLTRSTVAINTTGAGGDGGNSGSGFGGDGGSGGQGAGIYNTNTTLAMVGSAIYGNATGPGGSGGSGTLGDGDDGYRGSGGGIYTNNFSDVTLSDTTIRDNAARYGGGLCSVWESTTTLDGCTVSGNIAGYSGGGIYGGTGATLALTNTTVSDNSAYEHGGGIHNYMDSAATLTFVTVTDNTADVDNDGSGDGGGLYNLGTFTMTNTIVAVNEDKGGEDRDCSGTFVSGDYNLLGIGDSAGCTFTPQPHDQVGTAASPIDPLLGLLRDNGGDTLTHALLPGSQAINGGSCVVGVETDQRGLSRPYGDDCDVGAYELHKTYVYLPLVLR